MSALFVVLPLAVFISTLAVAAFLWAARRGQLDDLETPALRMLHDDAARVVRPPVLRGSPDAEDQQGPAGGGSAPHG